MTPDEMKDLDFAIRLLAKTVDEVSESTTTLLERHHEEEKVHADLKDQITSLRELITGLNQSFNVLPLVIAKNLEGLVEKKTTQAFEDIRITLDELRNKLYSIKKDTKSVRESTGAHTLPSGKQLADWEKIQSEKEEENIISVSKKIIHFNLPTNPTVKVVLFILVSILGIGSVGGGLWALIDKLKHLSGGG